MLNRRIQAEQENTVRRTGSAICVLRCAVLCHIVVPRDAKKFVVLEGCRLDLGFLSESEERSQVEGGHRYREELQTLSKKGVWG
jgi:hypothetical protein